MKRSMSLMLAAIFVLSACSTQKARVNYSDFKEMPLSGSSLKGEKIGPVEGEDGGAIWNECTQKAKGSVDDLIENARSKGANAVGDIRWPASGTSVPTCKKGWGYFLIWPFVLTPLFMSTKVTGIGYKVTGGKAQEEGLLMLPNTPAEHEAFVNRVVSGN